MVLERTPAFNRADPCIRLTWESKEVAEDGGAEPPRKGWPRATKKVRGGRAHARPPRTDSAAALADELLGQTLADERGLGLGLIAAARAAHDAVRTDEEQPLHGGCAWRHVYQLLVCRLLRHDCRAPPGIATV